MQTLRIELASRDNVEEARNVPHIVKNYPIVVHRPTSQCLLRLSMIEAPNPTIRYW